MYFNHHFRRVLTLLLIGLFGAVSTHANYQHAHEHETCQTDPVTQVTNAQKRFSAESNNVFAPSTIASISFYQKNRIKVTPKSLGIFSLLVGGLKRLAIYGGIRLGSRVLKKIFRKARNYEYYYNHRNPGAINGVNHIIREWTPSSCNPDGLPYGNPRQHIDSCEICSPVFKGINTYDN